MHAYIIVAFRLTIKFINDYADHATFFQRLQRQKIY
jgi:hypothetical protein